MTNDNDVRRAHEILDDISIGYQPNEGNLNHLRSFLPELPAQKTLKDITHDVYVAWNETYGNDWDEDTFGELEAWLHELHKQMDGLENVEPPELPVGMRLAKHENRGLVVATGWNDSDNEHFCVYRSDELGHGTFAFLPESSLTYLDSEPAHPKFLETEADYQNAPAGTVAAKDGWLAWVKQKNGDWSCDGGSEEGSILVQTGKRRVLRWGWTNE